jgi:Spy/CpxP family protein refolding chaperone
MKRPLQKILIAIIFSFAASVLLSGCKPPSLETRSKWIVNKIDSELDLTATQKTKLLSLRDEILATHRSHHAERAESVVEAKKIIMADRLDIAKVKGLMAARQKIADDDFNKLFERIAEFHAMLSLEQKKKAADWLEQFSKDWE